MLHLLKLRQYNKYQGVLTEEARNKLRLTAMQQTCTYGITRPTISSLTHCETRPKHVPAAMERFQMPSSLSWPASCLVSCSSSMLTMGCSACLMKSWFTASSPSSMACTTRCGIVSLQICAAYPGLAQLLRCFPNCTYNRQGCISIMTELLTMVLSTGAFVTPLPASSSAGPQRPEPQMLAREVSSQSRHCYWRQLATDNIQAEHTSWASISSSATVHQNSMACLATSSSSP